MRFVTYGMGTVDFQAGLSKALGARTGIENSKASGGLMLTQPMTQGLILAVT